MEAVSMTAIMLMVLIRLPLVFGNSNGYTLILQKTQQTCTDTCTNERQKCDFNGINKLELGELKSAILEILPGLRCFDSNTTLTQTPSYPQFKQNDDGFSFNLGNNCTSGYIFKPDGPIPNCSTTGDEKRPRICRCKDSTTTSTKPEISTLLATSREIATSTFPKPRTPSVSKQSITTPTKRLPKTSDNRWNKLSTSQYEAHFSEIRSTSVAATPVAQNAADGEMLTKILAGIGCTGTLICLAAIAGIILWIKKRRVTKTNKSILNSLKSKNTNIKNTLRTNKTETSFANKRAIVPTKVTSKSYPSTITPTMKITSMKPRMSEPGTKKSTNTKTGTVTSAVNSDMSDNIYELVRDPKRANTFSKSVATIKKM